MSKNIIISGIETNNLKNIDIELIEKGINLIIVAMPSMEQRISIIIPFRMLR